MEQNGSLNECQTKWRECLSRIKDIVSDDQYATWFEPIVPVSFAEGNLVLAVESDMIRDYLEKQFSQILTACIGRCFGKVSLKWRVKVVASRNENDTVSFSQPAKLQDSGYDPFAVRRRSFDNHLNRQWTFDNFIEGKSNTFARKIAMNVAQKPGAQFYNPLFVFGHSGLGKTHLVNALGVACVKAHPELNVLYLTANDFLNFMQRAVMEQKIPELLSYYQSVDVFIIDDIQEIGGNKAATQDLFFNVFNHLYQSGKQVIITADKAPKDIQGFEQRILSRFKWGLQTELASPDFDLKYSILKEKTKEQGVEIPDDVLRFVAERVPDNLRELDGVIASILAQSMFLGAPINIELASRIVSEMVTFREKTLSISDIQEKVCDYYKLSVTEIQTKSRKRDVVQARQIAMYLARKYTKSSLTVIGEQIGNRDHATVLHAVKTVMDLCETDREIRESVSTIEKELK